MKKEEFTALGIDEKLAEKAAAQSKKELEGYVPKNQYDELNTSKTQLETSVNDYKTQLETLKASADGNEALKQQIADLQAQNQQKDTEYKEKLKDLQMTNAIKLALASSAQDSDLVAGLIDKTKLILGDDGKITGLEEQVKALKESKAFLFKEEKPDPKPAPGFKLGVPPEPKGNLTDETGFSLKDAVTDALSANK